MEESVRYKDYTKPRSGQKQVDRLKLRGSNEVCLDQEEEEEEGKNKIK